MGSTSKVNTLNDVVASKTAFDSSPEEILLLLVLVAELDYT